MFRIETLYLNPNYKAALGSHNLDKVCYVIEKATNKTVDVAIVKRSSLANWYEQRRAKYPEDKHVYVLAGVSIIGEIRGASLQEAKDSFEDEVDEQEEADAIAQSEFVNKGSYLGKKTPDKVH